VPWAEEGRDLLVLATYSGETAGLCPRSLLRKVLDRAPDATMSAIRDEVVGFTMPGAGMTDFQRNSVTIAKAGIYDLRLHHDAVIMPVLKYWKVLDRNDFGPEGEKARDELVAFLSELDAQATRFVEQRQKLRDRQAARAAG